jgi:hypothetical protein
MLELMRKLNFRNRDKVHVLRNRQEHSDINYDFGVSKDTFLRTSPKTMPNSTTNKHLAGQLNAESSALLGVTTSNDIIKRTLLNLRDQKNQMSL